MADEFPNPSDLGIATQVRPPTKGRQILLGIVSKDPATRRMAVLFWLSWFVLAIVLVYTAKYYRQVLRERAAHPSVAETEAKHLDEFLKRQAEVSERKQSTVSLGDFDVELKQVPNQPVSGGAMNIAQLEIVLECDSKETSEFVLKHMEQVRNEVSSVLTPMDRDYLLSRTGKKVIKRNIQDRLNSWLRNGKIEVVYFAKLLLT